MNPSELTELRKQLGLSSVKFWKAVKVTHSSGWRYEYVQGHQMPDTVKELVRLRYQLGIDIGKINEENAPLIRQLLSADSKAISAVTGVLSETETITKAATRIIQHITKENEA